jgi:hypothetical protein
MYDWSTVPPDPHLDVSAFYIGGDTPHIATDAEIAGQSARWRLPIYTCDNPSQRNPTLDALSAVSWLRRHTVPPGSALGLDYEMAKDSAYLIAFDKVVQSAGYTTLLYGSLSTVESNAQPSAGYWTASWTGRPHIDPRAAATQYTNEKPGQPFDLSVVSDSLVLWDTQPPAQPSTGVDMPTFQNGSVKPGFMIDNTGAVIPVNATVLVVPPSGGGALNWGSAWLSLGCDFASVKMRVALKVNGTPGWAVSEYTITATDDRLSIPLPPGIGKISLGRVAQSATDDPAVPAGWMLEYGA